MLNTLLHRLFYKIRLAQYSSTLESIEDNFKLSANLAGLSQLKSLTVSLSGLSIFESKDKLDTVPSHCAEVIRAFNNAIAHEDYQTVRDLLPEVKRVINSSFQSMSFRPKSPKHKFLPAGYLLLLCFVVISFAYKPMKRRYASEQSAYQMMVNQDLWKQQTVKDILLLKDALARYYADNKVYPKSSGGWDAVVAAFGVSKTDWIPDLVPGYIKELPVDPRKSKESECQYMYRSDGINYKLIAHKPLGMDEVIKNFNELVDPIRPSWAFGIWSEGGKNW